MAKIGVAATKYIIKAKLTTLNGIVERPDVVGAIFGQTEGLLGEDLELRELQKNGRIGRIEVNVTSKEGKSEGTIDIPTSLSKEDTALIAAALETIDRIGPCDAKIEILALDDVRSSKRDFVVDRAKSLLEKMGESVPESQELSGKVKDTMRTAEITAIGPDKIPAGPDTENSAEIVLVEGRADVLNLLRAGVKNVVAIGGTNIPASLKEVCKGKELTAFLDGDRGGDLILKELSQLVTVKYEARAPAGKEVEELTQKEILQALRNKREPGKPAPKPSSTMSQKPRQHRPKPRESSSRPRQSLGPELKNLGKIASSIVGTSQACLLKQSNKTFREIGKVPRRELSGVLKNLQTGKVQALILDGEISSDLANDAGKKGINVLVGTRKARDLRRPGMKIFTVRDLRGGSKK